MPNRLKDKVALVVGAGSIGPGWGNGKAAAVAFAREGAKVMCADINLAAAEETAGIVRGEGGEAAAVRADVTRDADVRAMVEACRKAYGRIDILDNNVGIAEGGGVVELPEAEWDRVMAINLRGTFLCVQGALRIMMPRGHGRIVTIGSDTGKRGGGRGGKERLHVG